MRLPVGFCAALLLPLILAVCWTVSQAQDSSGRYLRSDGPLQLTDLVSTDVITETNLRSERDCVYLCSERGCAAVSVMLSSSICQLLIINDASQSPGPIGSHVRRALGSEADAKVWKVEDFEDLVGKRLPSNFTVLFTNISSGRNGSIQQSMVWVTGCYRIEASGAAGGSNNFTGKLGGRGTVMSGSFNLTAGTRLSIVVGQAGGNATDVNSGGGGGGGSFVYRTEDSWLYLAAGAGGGAVAKSGSAGQSGINGSDSIGTDVSLIGKGGAHGSPGSNNPGTTASSSNHGGCGAGWLGKPVNPRRSSNDGDGGGSLADGWVGGQAGNGSTGHGGFGGGGGTGGSGGGDKGAGGAGGGFSGGGAGVSYGHAGGGGGSFCSGSGCNGTAGGNAGSDNGLVSLKRLGASAMC